MDDECDNSSKIECTESQESVSDFAQRSNKLRTDMISRIAQSDVHFKHQQRGDPDLTHEDKVKIVNDILLKNPSLFLSRFGQFISMEDVLYFDDIKDQYEVQFYLKDMIKQRDKMHSHKVVNNRRYAAMQELMTAGEYFSEAEMKWRDPSLYEEMIGRHMTGDEIQYRVDHTDYRLSTLLFRQMDQIVENRLYVQQKETEECQIEEEDTDDEDADEEMPSSSNAHAADDNGDKDNDDDEYEDDEDNDDDEKKKAEMPEVERDMLREEFLLILQERFMSGNDKDFDYSKVDQNARYDSLDTLGIDEEEKYFDDEDPHLADTLMTSDSPVLDRTPHSVTPPVSVLNPIVSDSQPVVEDVEDYMTFDPSSEVTDTAVKLTKMTVTCQNDNMENG